MHFEMIKDEEGKFFMQYWNKGREIWKSSESYERRSGALRSFVSIAKAFNRVVGDELTYWDHTGASPALRTLKIK